MQSAGVAIIDLPESPDAEPTVLCVRAYANWDFPKGLLEETENKLQAATREVEEETTLSYGNDYILAGQPCTPIVYGSGAKQKTATYFIGVRTSDKTPYLPVSEELGKPENDEFRWVLLSELNNLLPPRLLGCAEEIKLWTKEAQWPM